MNERTTDGAAPATRLPEARDASYTQPHGAHGGAMTGVEAERVEAERRAERARTRREPLARADRIQIAMFAGLVAIFAAMLGAGALGFTAISGQLLDMQKQIGELRTEMHDQIGELRMQKQIGELRWKCTMRSASSRGLDELSGRRALGETRRALRETRRALRENGSRRNLDRTSFDPATAGGETRVSAESGEAPG